jgi:hypothetical protein
LRSNDVSLCSFSSFFVVVASVIIDTKNQANYFRILFSSLIVLGNWLCYLRSKHSKLCFFYFFHTIVSRPDKTQYNKNLTVHFFPKELFYYNIGTYHLNSRVIMFSSYILEGFYFLTNNGYLCHFYFNH